MKLAHLPIQTCLVQVKKQDKYRKTYNKKAPKMDKMGLFTETLIKA